MEPLSLHLEKSSIILGNLQRIRSLQTLVCLLFITTLGIIFNYNSFELSAFDGDVKSWIHGIELNSILYITAAILGVAYLFIRNMLFIPAFIAILIPILSAISPAFRHPVFFLVELNLISLIVFPLFYYKYKDLGWINEINRFLVISFISWMAILGLSQLTGYGSQEHILAPTLSVSSMMVYTLTLLAFPGMIIGAVSLFIKRFQKIGNIILFLSLGMWLVARIWDGAYMEAIPLTFLLLQYLVLMGGMKKPLLEQVECLRNGLFKVLILASLLLPILGFSTYFHRILPEDMTTDNKIYSTQIQAYHPQRIILK